MKSRRVESIGTGEKLKESEFRENMPEIQSSPRDVKSLTSRKKSMKPPQSASIPLMFPSERRKSQKPPQI